MEVPTTICGTVLRVKLRMETTNKYWATVALTNDYLLTANPNLPEPMAHLEIRTIGPGFEIPAHSWTGWITGGWHASCVHELQAAAMRDIETSLRQNVPSSQALLKLAHDNLPKGA